MPPKLLGLLHSSRKGAWIICTCIGVSGGREWRQRYFDVSSKKQSHEALPAFLLKPAFRAVHFLNVLDFDLSPLKRSSTGGFHLPTIVWRSFFGDKRSNTTKVIRLKQQRPEVRRFVSL